MLYDKIVEYCQENGVSLFAFEKKCGLGNGTIKGWMNSNPRIDSLKKVAEKMGVPIEQLIKDEGKQDT